MDNTSVVQSTDDLMTLFFWLISLFGIWIETISLNKTSFKLVNYITVILFLVHLVFGLTSSSVCRYGDMRVMMTYELFSMWQNLGKSFSTNLQRVRFSLNYFSSC